MESPYLTGPPSYMLHVSHDEHMHINLKFFKKINNSLTTHPNQNSIIVLCLFLKRLQDKIPFEYVFLKMVKLFFKKKQTLLPLPYKLVTSYLTSCTLLTSYFLSRTRKLFFLKFICYNVTFLNFHEV